MNRKKLIQLIQDNVINTQEASELIECNRQYVSALVKSGRLVPVKKYRSETLFLKSDVIDYINTRQAKR